MEQDLKLANRTRFKISKWYKTLVLNTNLQDLDFYFLSVPLYAFDILKARLGNIPLLTRFRLSFLTLNLWNANSLQMSNLQMFKLGKISRDSDDRILTFTSLKTDYLDYLPSSLYAWHWHCLSTFRQLFTCPLCPHVPTFSTLFTYIFTFK